MGTNLMKKSMLPNSLFEVVTTCVDTDSSSLHSTEGC